MSATPAPPAAPATRRRSAAPAATAASDAHLTFGRVVRSEWMKLFSLRSTWWSLGITLVLSVGISLLLAATLQGVEPGLAHVTILIAPMQFTMLVAGILGAMAITGEYSTGMIRSTFTAEPRRGRILAAKALVVGGVMALTTAVGYAIAALVTTPLVRTPIDLADPAASWLLLLAGILAMACFALIGLGFGFIIRNGAGAIAATVGLLFVAPIVFGMFALAGNGWTWLVDASAYLPVTAAQRVTTVSADRSIEGVIALLAWPAALLALAWVMLRNRDA